jgi:hypothetical protein
MKILRRRGRPGRPLRPAPGRCFTLARARAEPLAPQINLLAFLHSRPHCTGWFGRAPSGAQPQISQSGENAGGHSGAPVRSSLGGFRITALCLRRRVGQLLRALRCPQQRKPGGWRVGSAISVEKISASNSNPRCAYVSLGDAASIEAESGVPNVG